MNSVQSAAIFLVDKLFCYSRDSIPNKEWTLLAIRLFLIVYHAVVYSHSVRVEYSDQPQRKNAWDRLLQKRLCVAYFPSSYRSHALLLAHTDLFEFLVTVILIPDRPPFPIRKLFY